MNSTYKAAVLTKVALEVALLFVALAVSLLATPPLPSCFLNENAGNFPILDKGLALGVRAQSLQAGGNARRSKGGVTPSPSTILVSTRSVACFPKSALLPIVSEYPKTSPAELYERLTWEGRVKWSEPARLPGN